MFGGSTTGAALRVGTGGSDGIGGGGGMLMSSILSRRPGVHARLESAGQEDEQDQDSASRR
jgi:hypothetical protein